LRDSGQRAANKEIAMQTDEFLGQVQNKAQLATLGEAVRATRATLETLAERLGPDEARHLAAQLPHEIQLFLADAGMPMPERFSSAEFLLRVCAREGIDLPESTHHARAVIDVLTEAVSPGEIVGVFDRLPDDYRRLFPANEGATLRQ
jgi:uncharacterized protein (DUF2267 family)